MALMDYRWCDICGTKCFYDSVLDIEALKEGVGVSIVLCKECSKTYEIVVRRKKGGRIKFVVDDKKADWNGSYYIDWSHKKCSPGCGKTAICSALRRQFGDIRGWKRKP